MKKKRPVLLPPTLKSLVNKTVALFGEMLRKEHGNRFFQRIEALRQNMSELSDASDEVVFARLQKTFSQLQKLSAEEKLTIARAFTLMLELMNACENAYRTSRNPMTPTSRIQFSESLSGSAEQITYVLTAHPTEARSPENIDIFHQIQCLLISVLKDSAANEKIYWQPQKVSELKHFLEVAWRTWIVRHRAPKVRDEAEHIYSTLFRSEVFDEIMSMISEGVPLRVYTWVGGDKDGHPGVQEQTLIESLTLSRAHLVASALRSFETVRKMFLLLAKGSSPLSIELHRSLSALEKDLRRLKKIEAGDGARVVKFQSKLKAFVARYQKAIGEVHPSLAQVLQLLRVFPALVIPLELRESSDVLMSEQKKPLAIDRMLQKVEKLSRGGSPKWYVHSFIISMAQSMDHIRRAALKQSRAFGSLPLPITPLFEDVESLKKAPAIISEFVQDKNLKKAATMNWNGTIEIMVGYSDSSKEAGVLYSRLAIARALPALEKICKRAGLTPVFFHGSGGSVDRGGGTIQDQTAWWPHSALRNYKVTIQGEMVERTFATPEIARSQIQHILQSAQAGLKNKPKAALSPTLSRFAEMVQWQYSQAIHSEDFLAIVEKATPYGFLRFLKMGSRPSKRAQQLAVSGLRAIPWILCWTQTRVLFPTWWGVGSAWAAMTSQEQKQLQKDFREQPVFKSYVKALGFTLAKSELSVWRMYLKESALPEEVREEAFLLFQKEWMKTCKFFKAVSGQKDFTWERPWLGESISVRAPMIHPLNLLQILAQQSHDLDLLRVTATGISSGMMTTG